MKSQTVRLADVIIVGPLMIWGGIELSDEHPFLGTLLGALGVATILYNGRNYLNAPPELAAAGLHELLPGGRAARRSPSSFDPRQLRIGTRVEMEHTSDPTIAREIAMDHLVEDPLYYPKLLRAGL